nr:hypothetical protein [Tanacetum cinerariifolium]
MNLYVYNQNENNQPLPIAGKRILGHTNMHLIQSLATKELVKNLPKLKFDQHFYDACKIRKHAHASHRAKNIVSMTICLELLHMDLFGPSAIQSYIGNRYTLVIVDDYSRKVKESLNRTFDETPPPSKTSPLVDDDLDEEEAIKIIEKKNLENNIVDETLEIDEIVNIKESRNHRLENIIENLNQKTLRSQAQNQITMQEELYQFITSDVWELVPQPRNMKIIGTKWVFRNKLDENIIVSQNKARLVAQGYNQQEGIDYDETYASVARLESIRILLAYACALDIKLFQTDVKSAFLNGFINEEVYTVQPLGFINFEKPNHVYKLKKALYCLKQAPKACSTCKDMCDNFAKIMHDEFEMSMMGGLNFFLGLQIKQIEDGIFFNQSKYIKEMLKKFSLEESKPMKTSMSYDTKLIKDEECELIDSTKYRGMIGLWYLKGIDIEIVVYADYDHAGDYVDRKRSSGIYTFVNLLKFLTYLARVSASLLTNDREGQVRHIRYKEEIDVLEYQVLTREIKPTLKPLEEIIRENVFCLGKGSWNEKGRHSTSSSFAFDQPSSFHLNDDDDDGNGKGTSHASTLLPIRYVSSLTNEVPQSFQNPPNIDPHLEPFYTCQTKIINRQVQIRDEHREGLRSIRKGLRNLWRNIKK